MSSDFEEDVSLNRWVKTDYGLGGSYLTARLSKDGTATLKFDLAALKNARRLLTTDQYQGRQLNEVEASLHRYVADMLSYMDTEAANVE